MLAVNENIVFDYSTASLEYHTHTPHGTLKLENNYEIRTAVSQQDMYTLPCESFLYIEGKLMKTNGTRVVKEIKFRKQCNSTIV